MQNDQGQTAAGAIASLLADVLTERAQFILIASESTGRKRLVALEAARRLQEKMDNIRRHTAHITGN